MTELLVLSCLVLFFIIICIVEQWIGPKPNFSEALKQTEEEIIGLVKLKTEKSVSNKECRLCASVVPQSSKYCPYCGATSQ